MLLRMLVFKQFTGKTLDKKTTTLLHTEHLEDRCTPAGTIIDDPDGLLSMPELGFPGPPVTTGPPGFSPGVNTSIVGIVSYDQNGDGHLELKGPDNIINTRDDEPGIDGRVVRLYLETNSIPGLQSGVGGDLQIASQVTTNGGLFSFYVPNTQGTFYIAEDASPNSGIWIKTKPLSSDYYSIDTTNNGQGLSEYGRYFGEVKLVQSQLPQVHGNGFWTSNNGKSLLQSSETQISSWRTVLNSLHLCDVGGAPFTIPLNTSFDDSFNLFRNWVKKDSDTNMAYYLSVQLALTKLDVNFGFLNGNNLVYAPGLLSASPSSGVTTVATIIDESNRELLIHTTTFPNSDESQFRQYQLTIYMALIKAENYQLTIEGLVFNRTTLKWEPPSN
jgi:hypothetical protein